MRDTALLGAGRELGMVMIIALIKSMAQGAGGRDSWIRLRSWASSADGLNGFVT